MKDIKQQYFKGLNILKEKNKKDKDNVTVDKIKIKQLFEEKIPYISGNKKINELSSIIKDSEKKYFMNKIYKEIIQILYNNKGKAYFFEEEWINFKIGEIYYHKYIFKVNGPMSLLYNNYTNHLLNHNDLFTENDKYNLPQLIKGLDYERNVFQYFQLKIKLNEGSDFLFRINTKIMNIIIIEIKKLLLMNILIQ